MSGETMVTVVGNLTADPELRFTPSGQAVASFTVATNPRRFDKKTGGWVDDDPAFFRCSLWREAAENVTESLRKGMRVIVTGRLVQRSYTTREGDKRTTMEVQAEEVGPSLRWARVQVQARQQEGRQQRAPGGGQDGDPWATEDGPSW